MLKKVLAIILSASCLLATASSLSVSANDDYSVQSSSLIVVDDNVNARGKYVPSYYNYVDMSTMAHYSCGNATFKHLVYSEVMFTGRTYYTVRIASNNLKSYLSGGTDRWVAINFYNSDGVSVGRDIITSDNASIAFAKTFMNLNANSRYYFSIEKKQDNIYIEDLQIGIYHM